MAYTLWRGVVGMIKPTRRPGSLEELIRLLPEGIGVVPLLLNVRQGSEQEFKAAIPHYEKYVAERLIDAVCALDYPKERLEIQVLDDSTDDTVNIVAAKAAACSMYHPSR